MRFITREYLESIPFYSFYTLGGNDSYASFILRCFDRENKYKGFKKKYESANERYIEQVQYCFNENVMFYDELKDYIFDENKNIKPLDMEIFLKLKTCTQKYQVFKTNMFSELARNADKILNGDFDKDVKELVRLSNHDAIISLIDFEKPFLKMIIETTGVTKIFIFHTTNEWDEENLINFKSRYIGDEEIILNDDGTFEYNIIDDFDDISINFCSVEFSYKIKELVD